MKKIINKIFKKIKERGPIGSFVVILALFIFLFFLFLYGREIIINKEITNDSVSRFVVIVTFFLGLFGSVILSMCIGMCLSVICGLLSLLTGIVLICFRSRDLAELIVGKVFKVIDLFFMEDFA